MPYMVYLLGMVNKGLESFCIDPVIWSMELVIILPQACQYERGDPVPRERG